MYCSIRRPDGMIWVHRLSLISSDLFLTWHVDEEDRRRRTIDLTADGRDRLSAALPLWRGAQSEMIERLGEPSLEAFYRQLGQLEHARDGA